MPIRFAVLLPVLISTVSCFGPALRPGVPIEDAYHGARRDALAIHPGPSPLARTMTIPVIQPPEIFPVYVPTHVDTERDMMVGEHFLFLKLRDATWFAERWAELPLPDAKSSDDEVRRMLARLATADWDRIVVPHKE